MARETNRPPSSTPESRGNLYRMLEELDRLEELLEDMNELGVASRAEAEARMRELEEQVEALENG
jgi:hypothetical protein